MTDATLKRMRILSKKELRKLLPNGDNIGRRTQQTDNFPPFIDLGDNRVGWFETDIIAWIKSRPVREYPATDDDST